MCVCAVTTTGIFASLMFAPEGSLQIPDLLSACQNHQHDKDTHAEPDKSCSSHVVWLVSDLVQNSGEL